MHQYSTFDLAGPSRYRPNRASSSKLVEEIVPKFKDVAIVNATVRTIDARNTIAQALLMKRGKIAYVGYLGF